MALIKKLDPSATKKAHWFSGEIETEDGRVQRELKETCELPAHIAIIMDGNGRWARLKGKTRIEGHAAGVSSVRDVVEASIQLGIPYLTLFTFSTENWKRPEKEVSALMQLIVRILGRETRALHDNNVRLNVIGNTALLPEKVRTVLENTIELTKNNSRLVLNIALSYSGKWDITQACATIARDVKTGLLDPNAVTEQLIESRLSTASMPDPELIIRTSGEFRISNFMIWQSAYSEIYFTNTYWPDFRRAQLYEAIRDYQGRERRFGQTSDQIRKTVEHHTEALTRLKENAR
ncbi:MAG: di-trans,poly-cis-decaprenylcistransferase [Pelodictyon luteolum]|uniref:Isoprenyl transferase n=1 Tax=Pelodictyon luteolum TaxID=1100 RepID=A0A165L7K3_PELLU|nr:isoprenyl transferase [Pelodictyon luteolum]KZK73677.1 MAG: di-trans,poly-cis-decaprenylcistransferase [Pelodictyon luteolum]